MRHLKPRYLNATILLLLICAVAACTSTTDKTAFSSSSAADSVAKSLKTKPMREKNVWLPLFDGKTLNNWTPKFSGYPVGENVKNTFTVKDGLLTADYSKWSYFDYTFGHLFFNEVFHYYKIRAEYRFIGEQIPGAPDWAARNNGLFVHAQSAESMWLNQDFPSGVEIQFLGGIVPGESRSTGNLCRSNVNVDIDGKKAIDRCIRSSSETYYADQWVTAEIHVRGSERITHYINGQQVFDYTNIRRTHEFNETQLGETTVSRDIGSGYIAIQAESQPTQFRKIEIMILDDPFDKGGE